MPIDFTHWIRLEQTPGVGSETARKLLSAFGLPENIFSASFSALQKVVSERVARALIDAPSVATQALIARTHEWLEQPGNHLLTLGDADYPPSLLNIPDPPIMLYVKGQLALLRTPALAVVGSRNATTQGIANAEKFSEALSRSNLMIVSGLALGIDTAAHQGALRGSGSTVAVIGTGADIVYPARNRTLAHQIVDTGCIISEYPLGTPAIAANFPRRNRIISGLARGVLVIEAAAQSGSLITARMAGEQGREVFAIPGSIHSPLSKGCHQLIKQGAKLVESAQDILEELKYYSTEKIAPQHHEENASSDSAAFNALLTKMGFDPVDADQLVARSGLDAAELSTQLLALEMANLVEMLPGGLYQRVS